MTGERPNIRVVIAEDQTTVLGALGALLGLESDIEVIALAHDAIEAMDAVKTLAPDILITDIEMPGKSGLEVAREVDGTRTRVIILTTFARPGYMRQALAAGASGYLLKARPAEQLADAIRRVHHGLRVVDPGLAAERSAEDPLTDRERQVLRLAADGASNKAIAKELGLSHGTVRNYLSSAIAKLGASNRFGAARAAKNQGWL